MPPAQIEETTDEPRVLRVFVLVIAAVALVLCLLAFRSGRDRVVGEGAGPAGLGANAYDLVVTAPTEPVAFTDTTIWALPSQAGALFPADDGLPTLRLGSLNTGALVGLESAQGLVALAQVPPGLPEEPVELFISQASTVLALAGLHPDMTTSDTDTYIARLISAAQTPEFSELAGIVDGDRSIATWGQAEQGALQRIVNQVLTGAAGAPTDCPDAVVLAGPIARCGDIITNTSPSSVLIANADGRPCVLVPGASQSATTDGLRALQALIANGAPITPGLPLVNPAVAGSAELGVACGDTPQVFVDEAINPLWLVTAAQFVSWTDDITPMARILGADIAGTPFPTVNPDTMTKVQSLDVGPAGAPTAAERLRAIDRSLQEPRTATGRGLLPLTNDASSRLQGLTDLLAGVFQ